MMPNHVVLGNFWISFLFILYQKKSDETKNFPLHRSGTPFPLELQLLTNTNADNTEAYDSGGGQLTNL